MVFADGLEIKLFSILTFQTGLLEAEKLKFSNVDRITQLKKKNSNLVWVCKSTFMFEKLRY